MPGILRSDAASARVGPISQERSATMTALSPGLTIFYGNQPEQLRSRMVDQLKRQPLAPLDAEWLLVQSNGMRDWLELGLATVPCRARCAGAATAIPLRQDRAAVAPGAPAAGPGAWRFRVRAAVVLPGGRSRWAQAVSACQGGGRRVRWLPELPRRLVGRLERRA